MAKAQITPGVCGFEIIVTAESEDQQSVAFHISGACPRVSALAEKINALGAIDAFVEIDPRGEGPLASLLNGPTSGCCPGCVVPNGIFKAMQISAGLSLPGDVHLTLTAS